jgi:hypothetical protein
LPLATHLQTLAKRQQIDPPSTEQRDGKKAEVGNAGSGADQQSISERIAEREKQTAKQYYFTIWAKGGTGDNPPTTFRDMLARIRKRGFLIERRAGFAALEVGRGA